MSVTWGVKVELTDEELKDLLITAVEGGINHWAQVKDYRPDRGTVTVREMNDDDPPGPWTEINTVHLAIGMQRCAEKMPRVFARWLQDRCGDADVADIIFQLSMLGEHVYA
jgi:hypothetical protein